MSGRPLYEYRQVLRKLTYGLRSIFYAASRDQNVFNINVNDKTTGLFISPSGTSEFDCATTKTDTVERSISIGRESLKVFFCTRGLGVLAGSTAMGYS